MNPVVSALDQWNINTRRAATLEQAMETAFQTLPNTRFVTIWPDEKTASWLITATFEIKPN
jgi:hypothetical protein